jgi:hypothetical protein
MRLLFWIVAFGCMACVANAQQTQHDKNQASLPADNRTPLPIRLAPPPPPPPEEHHTFYYRPGDVKGVAYDTIGQCSKVREEAGNVGICVIK